MAEKLLRFDTFAIGHSARYGYPAASIESPKGQEKNKEQKKEKKTNKQKTTNKHR